MREGKRGKETKMSDKENLYWNCLGDKLTYFKRIGHVKNMLKGNQYALPRRVRGVRQQA